MYCIRFMSSFLILSTLLLLYMGCRLERSSSEPHPPNENNKKETVEVTVGGKVWKINPDLAYRAIGVWTNPSPRPLTDLEKERRVKIKSQIQALETQLNQLDKELGSLERIEKPEIKFRFRFGASPHSFPPPDFSSGDIIDLGEFPMDIENPTAPPSEQ